MSDQTKLNLSPISQTVKTSNKKGNNDNIELMENNSSKIIQRFSMSNKAVKPSIKISAHELTNIKTSSSKIKEQDKSEKISHPAPQVISRLSSITKNLLSEFVRRSLMKTNKNSLTSIIEILKLKHELRTKENIKWLKVFVLESKLKEYLISFNKTPDKNLDEIVLPIIAELKYYFYPVNSIIYKIGDSPQKYIVIIKGKIVLEKYEIFKDDMTCFEYMQYIYKLYIGNNKKGDKVLLDKTLKANNRIFNINPEEVKVFNYILLKYKLADYIKDLNKKFVFIKEPIEEILINCFYKKDFIESVNYDPNKKDELKYMIEIINTILNKLKPAYDAYDEDIINNYLNFLYQNKHKVYAFKKFKLSKEGVLKSGDYLADNILDSEGKIKINATALEDTHVAYIGYNGYLDIIIKYKKIIKNKLAKFIKETYFYDKISLNYLVKNYLNEFQNEELTHGNTIFSENKKPKYVYFFKEGVLEIFCDKSIFSLFKLTEKMVEHLEISSQKEIKEDLLSLKRKISNFKILQNESNKKMNSRLFIYTKNSILALESWFFDLPYFYSCKVLSEKAVYYKIDYNILKKLISDLKDVKEIFHEKSNFRLNILLKRFIKICKTRIDYISKVKIQEDDFNILKNLNQTLNSKNKAKGEIIFKKLYSSEKLKKLFFQKISEYNKNFNHSKNTLSSTSEIRNSNNLFKLTQTVNPSKKNKIRQHSLLNGRKFLFAENNFEKKHSKNNTNKIKIPNLNLDEIKLNSKEKESDSKVLDRISISIENEVKAVKIIGQIVSSELLLTQFKPKNINKVLNLSPTPNIKNDRESAHNTINSSSVDNKDKSKRNSLDSDNNHYFNKTTSFNFFYKKKSGEFPYNTSNQGSNRARHCSERIPTIKSRKIVKNDIFYNIKKTSFNYCINNHKKNNRVCNSCSFSKFKKNNSNIKSLNYYTDRNTNINNYFSNDSNGFSSYKFRGNKYLESEKKKYKRKLYKVIHQRISEEDYFYSEKC